MRRELRSLTAHFDSMRSRLNRSHPGVRLTHQAQRLDDLEQRLTIALRASLRNDRSRLSDLSARLVHRSPDRLIRDSSMHHAALSARLRQAWSNWHSRTEIRIKLAARTLDAVSPLATLSRGFAIVTRADGTLLTDSRSVAVGDEIEARLGRGRIRAKVEGKED
jgi:exodeoxyribonuclease VII large subunit